MTSSRNSELLERTLRDSVPPPGSPLTRSRVARARAGLHLLPPPRPPGSAGRPLPPHALWDPQGRARECEAPSAAQEGQRGASRAGRVFWGPAAAVGVRWPTLTPLHTGPGPDAAGFAPQGSQCGFTRPVDAAPPGPREAAWPPAGLSAGPQPFRSPRGPSRSSGSSGDTGAPQPCGPAESVCSRTHCGPDRPWGGGGGRTPPDPRERVQGPGLAWGASGQGRGSGCLEQEGQPSSPDPEWPRFWAKGEPCLTGSCARPRGAESSRWPRGLLGALGRGVRAPRGWACLGPEPARHPPPHPFGKCVLHAFYLIHPGFRPGSLLSLILKGLRGRARGVWGSRGSGKSQ